MRKVIRIDADGFFVEDVILGDYEPTPDDCVEIEVPEGMFRPKWDGTQWIEGLSQEEIDAIRNAPRELTPQEHLEQENALLALELAATQAQLEQAEQENAMLALELASTQNQLQQTEETQADLILQLTEKGVL